MLDPVAQQPRRSVRLQGVNVRVLENRERNTNTNCASSISDVITLEVLDPIAKQPRRRVRQQGVNVRALHESVRKEKQSAATAQTYNFVREFDSGIVPFALENKTNKRYSHKLYLCLKSFCHLSRGASVYNSSYTVTSDFCLFGGSTLMQSTE